MICTKHTVRDCPECTALRDEFAKAALTGILAADTRDRHSLEGSVYMAYRYADLMLAEREKEGG